jgi:hypothetical protein
VDHITGNITGLSTEYNEYGVDPYHALSAIVLLKPEGLAISKADKVFDESIPIIDSTLMQRDIMRIIWHKLGFMPGAERVVKQGLLTDFSQIVSVKSPIFTAILDYISADNPYTERVKDRFYSMIKSLSAVAVDSDYSRLVDELYNKIQFVADQPSTFMVDEWFIVCDMAPQYSENNEVTLNNIFKTYPKVPTLPHALYSTCIVPGDRVIVQEIKTRLDLANLASLRNSSSSSTEYNLLLSRLTLPGAAIRVKMPCKINLTFAEIGPSNSYSTPKVSDWAKSLSSLLSKTIAKSPTTVPVTNVYTPPEIDITVGIEYDEFKWNDSTVSSFFTSFASVNGVVRPSIAFNAIPGFEPLQALVAAKMKNYLAPTQKWDIVFPRPEIISQHLPVRAT